VQILCSRSVCANLCKHKLTPDSVQTCAKFPCRLYACILGCFGRGKSVNSWSSGNSRTRRLNDANSSKTIGAVIRYWRIIPIVEKLSAWGILVTQQRGFDGRPVKQESSPIQSHAGNFPCHAPVEQCAARDWQPCQQLLLVQEASRT